MKEKVSEFLNHSLFIFRDMELRVSNLLVALAIILLAILLLRWQRKWVRSLSDKEKINLKWKKALNRISTYIVLIVAFFFVLHALEINVAWILAGIRSTFDYTLVKMENAQIKVVHVIISVVIITSAWLVLRWLRRLLSLARHRNRLTVSQELAYLQLSRYFVIILTVVLVLTSMQVNITALLLGSSILLLGIGLGLQQIFNDFISGFFLLMENSVRVNDIVEVAGMVCKVKEIGVRTSKVMTRDGIIVIIPNSKIVSDSVINWSMSGTTTRFNINVGVAYGSDTAKVKKLLLECAARHHEVVKSPRPLCRFIDFGDSALSFELLFWSRSRFRIEDVKSDLRFMIDSEFRKNNIRIPFPQRDLHLRSDLTKGEGSEEGFSL